MMKKPKPKKVIRHVNKKKKKNGWDFQKKILTCVVYVI